ncbi:SRPBCC family protein [Leptospira ellisii]|uniref:Polyketide cyclase n=1 Tax=Leptospira ellisii TaxID=2023197 RepID=A0A2N0BCU6_9LEPT|nr:SRPBCC family protein [Leptospira ellisii]MDV6236712.1 SRPBCC family protein [Leptospira ellisii]PJZ94380.1 polyketide cyclase [Leptospira ellisii]PKA05534.1 polyketide cyclase [Leptospira ellisii]
MSKLKSVLASVAGLLILFVLGTLAYASTKPDTVHYQRSLKIDAPAEKIFALIVDFHSWGKWSPWEKLDPNMQRSYSGSPNGLGSIYEWSGNSDIGKGRMEITAADSPSKIVIKLDFLEPFEAHNTAEFTISPKDGGNEVTWAMHGPNHIFSKVLCLFLDMDAMIGEDFDKGLNSIKNIAETK